MFQEMPGAVEWTGEQETVRLEAWGPDAIRVRTALGGPVRVGLPGALLPAPPPSEPAVKVADDRAVLSNGTLAAEIGADGLIRFTRSGDGAELLAEEPAHFWWPGARFYTATGNGYHRLEQRFRAYPGERLYGLGQHQHGLLDQRGTVTDLVQRNNEVTIPLLHSSRGYGLLWNNPAIGRVELGATFTRWVADSARQLDYWVTAGDPAAVLARYAAVTGHPPVLPDWATGFWQSKLRYRTQDELMAVAREYRRRGVPLAVIVADFFHWTHLGDWRFDPAEWPDPAAMVAELAETGTKLMVSVWPSVSPLSGNYDRMRADGLLVGTEYGPVAHADWPDKGVAADVQVAFYDPTNPRARAFVWDRVAENYLSYGIDVFWLDACEPEMRPHFPANLRYHAGPGLEVGNLYPQQHARAFHDGLTAAGRDVVTLNRSAWAGSQRYGAALWSGDIGADFATLRAQVAAGLNVALSGIPWWTTDIGGFHGGDPDSPGYRELMVRWFQYGACCPLFRLHGDRDPRDPHGVHRTGGPNEIWSYGDEVYPVLRDYILLRERLRPYLADQFRLAHETGLPPMRPLFVDFPTDDAAWLPADEYLLGPDLLVAPVLAAGARHRDVYLPAGTRWRDAWTGTVHPGGTTVTADAPLDRIPLFLRGTANLPIRA